MLFGTNYLAKLQLCLMATKASGLLFVTTSRSAYSLGDSNIALLNNEPQKITHQMLLKILEAEPSLSEIKQQQRADALEVFFGM